MYVFTLPTCIKNMASSHLAAGSFAEFTADKLSTSYSPAQLTNSSSLWEYSSAVTASFRESKEL